MYTLFCREEVQASIRATLREFADLGYEHAELGATNMGIYRPSNKVCFFSLRRY